MTNGAPKSEVIALIGRMASEPGSCAIISKIKSKAAPSRMTMGVSSRWLAVLKSILPMCGTANPIKAIGPQNAVTVPANRLVLIMIKVLDRWRFKPEETA